MNFREFCGMTLAVAAVALTLSPAGRAATKADYEVQTLANFPALHRMSVVKRPKAIRSFLSRVSAAYRSRGYPEFAAALSASQSLITLFGVSKKVPSAQLEHARTSLRRLKVALAKNPHVVLPDTAGKSLPDYYGAAAVFLKNTERALKNLAQGKGVLTSLRNQTRPLWITKAGNDTFTLSGGRGSVAGTNTFAVGTTLSGGSLILSGGGSTGLIDAGSSFTFDSWTTLGAVTISAGSWALLPAEIVIPTDAGLTVADTFTSEKIVNGIVYPAGTRLVAVPDDSVAPDGAIALTLPITIRASFTLAFAGVTPTPTPEP